MIRWYARRRLDAFERAYDYDMSYARQLLAVGPRALMAFMKATNLSLFQGTLPRAAWQIARVVAIRVGDCGPCTQLVVKLAEKDGMPRGALRSALLGRYDELDSELALAGRFTEAALRREPQADALRDEVVRVFGESGLVALSLTMAGTTLYPLLKFALGHGHVCQQIQLGSEWVSPAGDASLAQAR